MTIDTCGIYLNIFTAVTHDRQSFVRYHLEGFQIYPPAQTQLAEVQQKLSAVLMKKKTESKQNILAKKVLFLFLF